MAGILNIITIGAGMEGYTVTLNGGASNTRVYGGGYGTVQSGKFTVTVIILITTRISKGI